MAAPSPDRFLVMLSWICLQVFSFHFSCLTALAGADHGECVSYFSIYSAAVQEGRGKMSDHFNLLMVTPEQFAGSPMCTADVEH